MTTRVHFTRMPPTPERLVWCEWLRKHGINPSDVLVDFIECREETYQIVYATYEIGYTQVPVPRKPGVPIWDVVEEPSYEIRKEMLKVEVVFQLEARPLPWPPVPPWPTEAPSKITFAPENGRD